MTHLRKFLPLLLLAGFILAIWPPRLAAQGDNQAALVVRFGDGSVQTRCVSFSEPRITGYDLLQRSGLGFVADVHGMGALVCSIGGTGCPAENCLCHCTGGGDCVYWSYWLQNGGNWQYSAGGSSMVPVTHGAVQGWSWGPGSVSAAVPPPPTSFESVCQVPATATPEPTPTWTAVPPTPTSAPEISFSADAAAIPAGSCTNLRWRVNHITAVYLNGGGVTGEETRQVCPAQTETYFLRIVYGGGEETRSLTVTVLPATPTTSSATLPASPTTASGQVGPATAVSPRPPTAAGSGPDLPAATAVAAGAATTDNSTPVEAVGNAPADDMATGIATDMATDVATDVSAITWVTVPPLPTGAPSPTIEAVAALSPLPTNAAPAAAGGAVSGGGETAVSWFAYAVFLALVAGLGVLILQANGRSRQT